MTTFSCKRCEREVTRDGPYQKYCSPCRPLANRERHQVYYQKNREYFKAYTQSNAKRQKAFRRENRQKVFDIYGNKCACCGEDTYEFLSLDHIDGGGK